MTDEGVEYDHRDKDGDNQSEEKGEAINIIRETITPKETGIKVNPNKHLFSSPAEECFTPR